MNTSNGHTIEIQGHRGCRGVYPENTLVAFEEAARLGVDAIEMDICISKDHKVVVSHEPFMSRRICLDPGGKEIPEAMDMKYNLYKMTYDEIKSFDCGIKYHDDFPDQIKVADCKPLLGQVIQRASAIHPNIKFNVEFKAKPEYDYVFTPPPKDYVNMVLKEIARHDLGERINLQSFDLRIMEEIRQQHPTIRTALLVNDDEEIAAKRTALSYTPEIISPYFKLVSKKSVASYQNQGFRVIPWTVNSEEDMRQMISFQVDAIITDFPHRLKAILKGFS